MEPIESRVRFYAVHAMVVAAGQNIYDKKLSDALTVLKDGLGRLDGLPGYYESDLLTLDCVIGTLSALAQYLVVCLKDYGADEVADLSLRTADVLERASVLRLKVLMEGG